MLKIFKRKKFESKEKIFFAFLSYAILSFGISVLIFLLFREMEKTELKTQKFNHLYVEILHALQEGDDFLIHGLSDENFYRTGSSPQLIAHLSKLNRVQNSIRGLMSENDVRHLYMDDHLISMGGILLDYQDSFQEFTDLLRDKGYHGYGLDGAMSEINDRMKRYGTDKGDQLDKLEKLNQSYQLTNDMNYVISMQKNSLDIINAAKKSPNATSEDLIFMLEEYLGIFEKIVQIDLLTGYKRGTGLEYRIKVAKSVVTELAIEMNREAVNRQNEIIAQLRLVVVVVVTASVILSLFLSVGLKHLLLD
jgi:hypothetical protein